MRAILLCAGLGTRLRPLTDDRPKCMVNVGGKPVLLRNIEWLRRYGVNELVVNLHYRPEVITDFLDDGSRYGVRVRYSFESDLLGTAGAVVAASPMLLPGPFLVVYADNLISCDLSGLLRRHDSSQAVLTLAVFFRSDVSTSGAVTLDKSDRILAFAEKSGQPIPGWVSAGLLLCEERLLEFVPRRRAADFGHDVIPALLRSSEAVQAYRMGPRETLRWIDTPDDLVRTEKEIAGLAGNQVNAGENRPPGE